MMLRVFLLAALAAMVIAQEDEFGCCSAEDRREIQFLWKKVWSSSFTDRKVTIAKALFNDLFERHPEAKALFTRVNIADMDSPEYRAHLVRVTNGLDTMINMMNDPDVLMKQVEHLTNQHVARSGVKGVYITDLMQSFENIMPQIAPCFNLEAWQRCFGKVAHMIAEKLP